jgi:sulfur carrier protein
VIAVRLNGEHAALPAGTTVADVVANLSPSPKGIAVARNGEVVPRSAWPTTEVVPGDTLEVLAAAQGG